MFLYRFIRFITFPFYWATLKIRNKENHAKFHEKMGRPTEDRPKGDIVWVHSHDAAESDELIKSIQSIMPGKTILLTHNVGTIENSAGVIRQFAPIDTYFTVRNFLHFWEPSFAIRNKSELRPYQLLLLKKSEIPSFLINAEVSDKSYRRWKFAKRTARKITRCFTFVWAIDNKQTLRMANLGANNIESQESPSGNLKTRDILNKIKI